MSDNIPRLARARIFVGAIREACWFCAVELGSGLLCGGRIGGGIFAGMVYTTSNTPMAAASKRAGTYEAELIPVILWAVRAGFDRFINAGAAEGYYSVGFARSSPATRVDAFEIDAKMRALLASNAVRNGVQDRIELHGRADAASLRAVLADTTEPFLLVDIEGGEGDLLDPLEVPALERAWLLVELHPHVRPDVAEILRLRFAGTHRQFLFEEVDWAHRRRIGERHAPFHWLKFFVLFQAEHRGGNKTPWLLMQPRTAGRMLDPRAIEHARAL